MLNPRFAVALLALAVCPAADAQIRSTSVPLGDAVAKALAKSLVTEEGARPFHLRVTISEPENAQSPYQGAIEEWWSSAGQRRREVTAKGGMHQTIVVTDGKKTERDEGDYFPLWLRAFVIALFDPVPDAKNWTAAGATIDQTSMPNGLRTDACARFKSKIGTGERATDAFSNVCFDGEGRLSFVGSPRYGMEFHDYRGFGKKQVARKLRHDPEPGTTLAGDVVTLEELSKVKTSDLFTPLARNDSRFESVQVSPAKLEELTAANTPVVWPPVHSGNVSGKLAMYVSIDTQGHVREAWPLHSDNAGLEDPAREQVGKWIIVPPVDSAGNPVQVDGGLGFSFNTAIDDPIPVLSDAEARQLLVKAVEPQFKPGTDPAGTRYRVRIAVNEQGKVTGGAAGDTEVPGTIKPAGNALFTIIIATREWQFKPFIKDGRPQYFFAELVFTVK